MGHFSGNICCHSFGAFHHLLTSSVFTLTFKCIPSHDVVSSQRSAQTNDTKTCQGSTVTFFLSNFCTPNNEVLKSACKLQAACNFTCAHAHAHASACNQPWMYGRLNHQFYCYQIRIELSKPLLSDHLNTQRS